MLVRWDRDLAPTVDNLVLMTKPYADKLEEESKEHRVPVCFKADVKAKLKRDWHGQELSLRQINLSTRGRERSNLGWLLPPPPLRRPVWLGLLVTGLL